MGRERARGVMPISTAGWYDRTTGAKASAVARLGAHLELAKPGLSLLMSASCCASYLISKPIPDGACIGVALGVFLLSAGGASLNNFHDRHLDASLQRTQERPLPSGMIAARDALFQAAALIVAGTLVLYLAGPTPVPPSLGLLAIGLYNFVYTPLKRTTIIAIVPGAICGALPVLVGWTAAGSAVTLRTLLLMAVVGVWQLPHFWLVLLTHRDDYSRAQLPTMLRLFSTSQLRRLVFIWTTVFVVMTLLLPLCQIVTTQIVSWALVANAYALMGMATYRLIIRPNDASYRALFRALNASAALVIGLIAMGPVL